MANPIRATLKRPLLHHLIIILYIAAPFANILLLMVFLKLPLLIILPRLVAGYGILATAWLLTAPLIGISLYFVNRFSWYLFLGHSSLILIDFVIKWISRPAFYLKTVPGVMNILILAGNLVLIVIIGYIIQRNFRAPYLQILNRSWRERERIPICHRILIDGEPLMADDLSALGCFVRDPGTKRVAGNKVDLEFLSDSLTIRSHGEIMRTTPAGIGIRFISLPVEQRRDIDRMLRKRFALRQKVDLACTCAFDQLQRPGTMENLSSGGCYIRSTVDGLSEGGRGVLSLEVRGGGRPYSLPGSIVWINRTGQHEKPMGFGYQFDRKQPAMMRFITLHYGQGALIR